MPMQLIDRRRFLQLGLATGVGAAAASLTGSTSARAGSGAALPERSGGTAAAPVPFSQRQLVVIDMAGGNDGLSMVPPRGSAYGAYQAIRPRTSLVEADILPLTASVGLHPRHRGGPGGRTGQAGPVPLRVPPPLVGR